MRVLVTWGSKRGGTEGIARIVGQSLRDEGHAVDVLPPREAARASGYEAVVVGGGLYANRWHPAARRFVRRREQELRRVPTWFFSSGPLDESAERLEIPPTRQVATLMERVGAVGHVTFGGRLAPDAKGFPASGMARTRAGDWRSPEHIRAWAAGVARALPSARPRDAVKQPGRSLPRLVLHAAVGWAACGVLMAVLLALASERVALAVHAALVPILFVPVARHYFAARGARDPLPAALAFVATVIVLDLVVVAGLFLRSAVVFASVASTWLPFALVFLSTWATGELTWMLPGTSLQGAGPAAEGARVKGS